MQLSASSHAVTTLLGCRQAAVLYVLRCGEVSSQALTSSSDSSSESSCEATAALAAAPALGFLAGGPALAAAFLAASSLTAASLAAWAAAAAAFSSSACRYHAQVGVQHTFLMQQQRQCMALGSWRLDSMRCSIIMATKLTAQAESGAAQNCMPTSTCTTSNMQTAFKKQQTPKAPSIWHIKLSPSVTLRLTSSCAALPSLGTESRSIASQSSAPSLSSSSAAGAAAASCKGSSGSSEEGRTGCWLPQGSPVAGAPDKSAHWRVAGSADCH